MKKASGNDSVPRVWTALELRPFQRRFLRNALAPGVDTAALSLPRGNGKSWLAARLLTRCLTVGDPLHVPGAEYLLCAGSIEQARLCFRFLRADLEESYPNEYRFIDSVTRIGAVHKKSNTRLRVLSSNGKTGMGIVGCPLLVADEPGSWEVVGGQLMNDAIQTAQGKPGSPMKVVYIGTLAPATSGWWHELIEDGSHASNYVQALQGDPEKWDQWPEIRRCNPLTAIDANFRRKLLEERDAARNNPRLKARFLSYRLNVPSADSSQMLLTVDDYQRLAFRDTPERKGQPIVALDLGQGRAFSAAVAAWEGGRVECLAYAPGIPAIPAQEQRDRVPAGTYEGLVDRGLLRIADGLRVPTTAQLWQAVKDQWGIPVNVLCDRFRLADLQDAIRGEAPVEPRVVRWSEAGADIRALRAYAADGPLAVAEDSRLLLAASLAVAQVKNDDQGNTRLVKTGSHNTARDDVAAALVLVAGAYWRASQMNVARGPSYAVV